MHPGFVPGHWQTCVLNTSRFASPKAARELSVDHPDHRCRQQTGQALGGAERKEGLACLYWLLLDDKQEAGPERHDSDDVQNFHAPIFSNAMLMKYRR
jgi:hypothetical protein